MIHQEYSIQIRIITREYDYVIGKFSYKGNLEDVDILMYVEHFTRKTKLNDMWYFRQFLDFGFAKQLKANERLKDLFGTPGYLAPETLRCQMYEDHKGYSFEVDIWALGVIMYTLLAGYAPFYHRQQLRMMRLIQEGRFEFTKEAWESISNDAKNLVFSNLFIIYWSSDRANADC